MTETIDFTGINDEVEPVLEQREESQIKNLVQDTSNLRSYILNELNIKDEFVTGDVNNPIKISVDDLTDKQILNIYKYGMNKNIPTYSEEEENIINLIREGKFEEYIADNFLQQEAQEEQYSDYDYYYWKMNTDYPGLSPDAIQQQYELEKDNEDVLSFKVEKIKEQYNNLLEVQNQQQAYESNKEQEKSIEAQKRDIINSVENLQAIHNFDIPIQIKNEVLSDIFESNNGETSRFIEEYIDNKEGLLYTATAVKMLPLIVKEYEMLLEELDALKNQNKNFINPEFKQSISNQSDDMFYDFNAGGFADFLTK
jgi:hypothetical protein